MLACPKFLPVLAVFTMIMFLSFNFLLKSTERLSGAAVFCDKQETLLSTTDNTLTANGELLSLVRNRRRKNVWCNHGKTLVFHSCVPDSIPYSGVKISAVDIVWASLFSGSLLCECFEKFFSKYPNFSFSMKTAGSKPILLDRTIHCFLGISYLAQKQKPARGLLFGRRNIFGRRSLSGRRQYACFVSLLSPRISLFLCSASHFNLAKLAVLIWTHDCDVRGMGLFSIFTSQTALHFCFQNREYTHGSHITVVHSYGSKLLNYCEFW